MDSVSVSSFPSQLPLSSPEIWIPPHLLRFLAGERMAVILASLKTGHPA